MQEFDYLVVGAGLTGATLARKFAEIGKRVLVIDKREHIGGNTFDYLDHKTGIRLSKYGAHIFHTDNEEVWDFVNRFSHWLPYTHKVKSYVNDQFVPIPVNIETVNTLFGLHISNELEMKQWLKSVQILNEPHNSRDSALARVGKDLYELMFENYTKKQWDLYPEELEPSVMERIPVRTDFNERYFNNKYEGLPKDGYTEFVYNILDHNNIEVRLNAPYYKSFAEQFKKIFFTGRIDDYFAKKFGELEYRSLDFEYETLNQESFQLVPVVNYPSLNYDFTRIIEYKKFYGTKSPYTVIAKEYSSDVGEAYYPIPSPKNRKIYRQYQEEAKRLEKDGIYFAGRLAEYKYYNMDEAIASALNLFKQVYMNVNNIV